MNEIRIPNEQGNVGKYDAECSAIFRYLQPAAVCLIVVGGPKGSGFSISTLDPALLVSIAAALTAAAEQIKRAGRQ